MSVANLSRLTEIEARALLEEIRWPDGLVCVHCGSISAKRLGGKAGEKGQIKCSEKGCRKKFTVRVGTIFEDSKISLQDWVYAFTRMCASKKGISAHQIHRELGVTYKTAWFMCHRIRYAMSQAGSLLSGELEADETYVGGKPRYKGQSKRGRGTRKTPVALLVKRGGEARTRVIEDVTSKTLKQFIRDNADRSSTINTDELSSYAGLDSEFAAHKVVTHSKKEYVGSNGASTNTAESYFAIMKRGIYGVFHHVGRQHLQRYCDEFAFRWNTRQISDVERTFAAIRSIEGKRLTYL